METLLFCYSLIPVCLSAFAHCTVAHTDARRHAQRRTRKDRLVCFSCVGCAGQKFVRTTTTSSTAACDAVLTGTLSTLAAVQICQCFGSRTSPMAHCSQAAGQVEASLEMQTHSHHQLITLGHSQRGYQGDKRCLWCDKGMRRQAALYDASQNHISRTSTFVTAMLVSLVSIGSSGFGRL